MADGILHPQRTEVVVRGDGNCFCRAIALWRDETSDRKHGEIRSLCNFLIEKYPQVFQPLLFASRSVEEHVKKSKLAGSWAETVDIFSCATLLKRTISTFSTKEKSGSLLTLSRSQIFRLLWKQRRVVNVPLF